MTAYSAVTVTGIFTYPVPHHKVMPLAVNLRIRKVKALLQVSSPGSHCAKFPVIQVRSCTGRWRGGCPRPGIGSSGPSIKSFRTCLRTRTRIVSVMSHMCDSAAVLRRRVRVAVRAGTGSAGERFLSVVSETIYRGLYIKKQSSGRNFCGVRPVRRRSRTGPVQGDGD